MSVSNADNAYQKHWQSNDWAFAAMNRSHLFNKEVDRAIARFAKGAKHFSFLGRHLDIENNDGKRNTFVVRDQNGTITHRLTSSSKEGLFDIFQKFIQGICDIENIKVSGMHDSCEVYHLLNSVSGVPEAYSGIPFPFRFGFGAKELLLSAKNAKKQLKDMQARAEEVIAHGATRVTFLGGEVSIDRKENGSGRLTWRQPGKTPAVLQFGSPKQLKDNVNILFSGRCQQVTYELDEIKTFAQNESKLESRSGRDNFPFKVDYHIELDKDNGVFVSCQNIKKSGVSKEDEENLQRDLLLGNRSEREDVIAAFLANAARNIESNFLVVNSSYETLSSYFGNQLVTHDLDGLKADFVHHNTFNASSHLYSRVQEQLDIQQATLDALKAQFDEAIYEEQFPISFGELYVDIRQTGKNSREVFISIAGEEKGIRIPLKDTKDLQPILSKFVNPLYQQYSQEIQEAKKKANSIATADAFARIGMPNSEGDVGTVYEAIEILLTADETIRKRILNAHTLSPRY